MPEIKKCPTLYATGYSESTLGHIEDWMPTTTKEERRSMSARIGKDNGLRYSKNWAEKNKSTHD